MSAMCFVSQFELNMHEVFINYDGSKINSLPNITLIRLFNLLATMTSSKKKKRVSI